MFGAWQRARMRRSKEGGLSCVGGMFRLGFGKRLHEHVETPNPFHTHCSQETTALPLLMVHVVKMLLPCLASPPLLHLLPVSPSPIFLLLCSACLHLGGPLMRRAQSFCICEAFLFVLRGGTCARLRVCTYANLCGRSVHLLRDVIACYSRYHSESEPSVGTPPPSTLQHYQPKQQRA